MNNDLSFTVSLGAALDAAGAGDTLADRLRWLTYNARISEVTARKWIKGGAFARVDLRVLRKVTETLQCTLDDVLLKTEAGAP